MNYVVYLNSSATSTTAQIGPWLFSYVASIHVCLWCPFPDSCCPSSNHLFLGYNLYQLSLILLSRACDLQLMNVAVGFILRSSNLNSLPTHCNLLNLMNIVTYLNGYNQIHCLCTK
ncbi:hypothetical protein C0J52_17573 [Blattella germanica]|nr:hypothetical protein C0J52_17573 [Blattella germanica]